MNVLLVKKSQVSLFLSSIQCQSIDNVFASPSLMLASYIQVDYIQQIMYSCYNNPIKVKIMARLIWNKPKASNARGINVKATNVKAKATFTGLEA